jgi:phosphatidylglycerophosphate synthase
MSKAVVGGMPVRPGPVGGRKHGPSLAELKAVCLKRNEVWRSRVFYRPVSIRLTWLLVRTPLSANGATYLSMLLGLLALALWVEGSLVYTLVGVALLQLATVLDHVDGELSRWRGSGSLGGLWLDKMTMDVWVHIALFFALPVIVWRQTGEASWLVLGAVLAFAKAVAVAGYGVREALTERARRGGSGASAGGAKGSILRWPARYVWEATKAMNTASLLVVADAVMLARGLAWPVVRGVTVTWTGAYVFIATAVMVLSIVLELVAGTRGPAKAELEPYK